MRVIQTNLRLFCIRFSIVMAVCCLACGAYGLPDGRPAGVWYGTEAPKPKSTAAIRLATYNVENLFDPDDDPGLSGEFDDAAEQTSESRLKALAATIRKLDADVLCLQEVESQKCLEWFRDKYLADFGYKHIVSLDAGYYRGIEQSVLSRFPIKEAHVLGGSDYGLDDMEIRRTPVLAEQLGGEWAPLNPQSGHHFQRAPLIATVQVSEAYALTVAVVHFKAGGYAHQRELEALKLGDVVSRLLHEDPSRNMAVLGDFNATPNAMSVKALRSGELGLVSAYDFRWDRAAPFATYTTHASSRPLDYILMSRGLAADCSPSSYFVLGTLHAPSNWDYRRAKEIPPPDGYASDHYPVVIDLLPSPDRGPGDYKPEANSPGSGDVGSSERTANGATGPDAGATQGKAGPERDGGAGTAGAIAVANPKPPGLKLRPLSKGAASSDDVRLAEQLVDAGWIFRMPRPKSSQAAWGVRNARTTWWVGYWANGKTKQTSEAQPTISNGFVGDGKGSESWRRGGSPARPTFIEWLCSEADGIEPESVSGTK
jgi:endonuclease/exonuclease/phosphatase family metal-dependent hydrolase